MSTVRRLCLTLLFAAMAVTPAAAQFGGATVALNEPSDRDVYAAGRYVDLLAPVTGDAVLAGQRITVGATVSEDVMAAGEIVVINAAVGDDVRAAGREVNLESDIAGHVVAAGQFVSIGRDVRIGDWAWLAGERVVVRGMIGDELRIAGDEVVVAGQVGGNVELAAEDILIDSTAVIGGDLIVRSEDEPEILEGAQIHGRVERLPWRDDDEASDYEIVPASGGAFIAVSVLVALLASYWLFPGFLRRSAAALTQKPLPALGLGLATLLATPLVAMLLLMTGIGALVGLPLAALYFVVLLLGYLAGLYTLGDVVSSRFGFAAESGGRRVLVLVFSVVAAGVIGFIPVLGPLALFALWMIGIGACVLAAWQTYRSE